MKTRFLIAAMLLMAFGSAKAQFQSPTEGGKNVNTVVVNATGDVTIRQSDQYVVLWDSEHEWHANYNMADTAVYLDGSADFDVTIPELNHLTLLSSGDVKSAGVLQGKDLSVTLTGSGDVTLDLDYDNVYVLLLGSGDVELRGKCNTLVSQGSGTGDLNIQHLQYGDKRDTKAVDPDMANLSEIMSELGENMQQLSDSVDWEKFERDMEKWAEKMEKWGRKMEKWGERFEGNYGKDYNSPRDCYGSPAPDKNRRPEKKSLLLDAHWNGFEAGLNMLFDPHISNVTTVNGVGEMDLGIRPFRSWYFGFNIADVGIAFNRKHTAGLFTGVGIGWNNFSWKDPVVSVEDPETGIVSNVPLPSDVQIKKSKLGLLYLQAPLMVELKPSRKLYIDLGVTGGLLITAWSKVKYMDNTKVTDYLNGYFLNRFKLDASLRIGGKNLGFFANYALIPIYRDNAVEHTHPLSFGLSLNF